MKKGSRAKVIFVSGVIFSLFIGCNAASPAMPSPAVTPVVTESPSSTATLQPATLTSAPTRTATLEPTLNATVQAKYETAIATLGTETAVPPRTSEQEATLIARFPYDLKHSYCFVEGLSPNGRWLATTCGYGDKKVLVVRNREGKQWVLNVKDFLGRDDPVGRLDTLHPVFWSFDETYLYFAPSLGPAGGSDPCFPRHGNAYGLFRLNLNWGIWKVLIPPAVSSLGYDLEFSPTGQTYVTDADGIRITDIKTGKVTEVNVDGVVMDLLWSPDGLHLAYSVERCGRQGAESAWVYIWGASTSDEPKLMRFSHEGVFLKVESWVGNSMLRVREEKRSASETLDTIYVYDIAEGSLMFRGTATPSH